MAVMANTQGPRERLIAASIGLVRENGVEATGLAALLERSGTARRSVYQHFPGGKNELVAASTRTAGRWIRRVLHDVGATMSTAELLTLMVDQMKANLRESDFRLGCPIAAAALAPADATGVREAAGKAFADWVEEVESLLVRDGRTPAAARSLAGFLISAIEGALVTAQAARSTEPLDQAAEHLGELLRG